MRLGQPPARAAGGRPVRLRSTGARRTADISAVTADGQEAGGLAGHDLVLAGRVAAGTAGSAAGSARRGAAPACARMSAGTLARSRESSMAMPAAAEDLGDLLVRGLPVGDVLGVRVGLPGLEQHGVDVDRFAVDRDAEQQGRWRREPGPGGPAGRRAARRRRPGRRSRPGRRPARCGRPATGRGPRRLAGGSPRLRAGWSRPGSGPGRRTAARRGTPGSGGGRRPAATPGPAGPRPGRPGRAGTRPASWSRPGTAPPAAGTTEPVRRAAGQGERVAAGDQQPAPARVGLTQAASSSARTSSRTAYLLPSGSRLSSKLSRTQQHRHPVQDMVPQDAQPVPPAPGRSGPPRRAARQRRPGRGPAVRGGGWRSPRRAGFPGSAGRSG